MRVINWLNLQLLQSEIDEITAQAVNQVSIHELSEVLVKAIMKQYPWEKRTDLIPLFNPSDSYSIGDWLAINNLVEKGQTSKSWKITRIIGVIEAQNPCQGSFKVLEFENKRLSSMACSIKNSDYQLPDFNGLSEVQVDQVANSVVEDYSEFLKISIAKLINEGRLKGNLHGSEFIPYHSEDDIRQIVKEIFSKLTSENPYISIKDITRITNLGPRSQQVTENDLQKMIQELLHSGGNVDLGNGYWTTESLFAKMTRNIPYGVPAPHIRSKIDIWTDEDQMLFNQALLKPLPAEIKSTEEEENIKEVETTETRGVYHSRKLPPLTYLHITQAYFPVMKILEIFPESSKLVHVKLMDNDYHDFLLDRQAGNLIALDKRLFYNIFSNEYPAGTYFWIHPEGNGFYTIAPKLLRYPIHVKCKVVHLSHNKLIIETIDMLMKYHGDSRIFKADLRFIDIDAFYKEAQRNNLSVRDAIIKSIQELSEGDPDNCAHITDIFNLVFLKRMCSPRSVSLMLYTQPCFIQLGDGYFRYEPVRHMQIQPQTQAKINNQVSGQGTEDVAESDEEKTKVVNTGNIFDTGLAGEAPILNGMDILKIHQVTSDQKTGEINRRENSQQILPIEESTAIPQPPPLVPKEVKINTEIPKPVLDITTLVDEQSVKNNKNSYSPHCSNNKVEQKQFIFFRIWSGIVRWWKRITKKSQEGVND